VLNQGGQYVYDTILKKEMAQPVSEFSPGGLQLS
jgi:hypothetical protein